MKGSPIGSATKLSFRLEASDKPRDMARATVVNKIYSRRGAKLPRGMIRITVEGPLSIGEMFVGEPVTDLQHAYNSVDPQRVTFDGSNDLELAAGEVAASDPICWHPHRPNCNTILVSFVSRSETQPLIAKYECGYAYFKPQTSEAGEPRKSREYVTVSESVFAILSIESMKLHA